MTIGLADRIREVMGEMSPSEFARAVEVTPANITFYLNGQTKSLKGETASRMERVTGYRAAWIATGEGPKRVNDDQLDGDYAAAPRRNVRKVPIAGTMRVMDSGDIEVVTGSEAGIVEISTTDPAAYGMRVRGNKYAPAIRDGWYLLIEPSSPPAVGEYVLIVLKSGVRMVKELLYARSDSIEVVALNEGRRDTIYMDEVDTIHAIAAVVAPSKWRAK